MIATQNQGDDKFVSSPYFCEALITAGFIIKIVYTNKYIVNPYNIRY